MYELLIDTTERGILILKIFFNRKLVSALVKNTDKLSEELLPQLQKFLKRNKIKLTHITKILVKPGPGGFSATRTGVAVANALALAMDVPVAEWPSQKIRDLVLPRYDKKPNITKPK